MIASATVVENLAMNRHGIVIVTEFPLGNLYSCKLRVTRIVDDLALVDEKVFVVAAFLKSKEWARAAKDVHYAHIREPRACRVELNYPNISLGNNLTSDNEATSWLVLSIQKWSNKPLLPTTEYLTD